VKRLSVLSFVIVGIAAALALVVFIAPNANPNPDGLEKVAADKGIDAGVTDHHLGGGPLADYGVDGVDGRYVGTWVAGTIGVAVTFCICAGGVLVARKLHSPARVPDPPAA
jgi:cobalt/nickel transport system permease protein